MIGHGKALKKDEYLYAVLKFVCLITKETSHHYSVLGIIVSLEFSRNKYIRKNGFFYLSSRKIH